MEGKEETIQSLPWKSLTLSCLSNKTDKVNFEILKIVGVQDEECKGVGRNTLRILTNFKKVEQLLLLHPINLNM